MLTTASQAFSGGHLVKSRLPSSTPEEEAYLFTNAFILISKDNTHFLANPGRPRVNEVRQPWLFIPGHLTHLWCPEPVSLNAQSCWVERSELQVRESCRGPSLEAESRPAGPKFTFQVIG